MIVTITRIIDNGTIVQLFGTDDATDRRVLINFDHTPWRHFVEGHLHATFPLRLDYDADRGTVELVGQRVH